jgi:hypothetical protein
VHLNDPETHPMGSVLAEHENLDFLGKEIDEELVKQIARCQIDPDTLQSYEEMLLGRKKVEPTKVVFKKNTANKKGVAMTPSNQRLTKFFGVKKPVEHSQDYELGDHDEIDDDKSTVEKDTVKSLTNFAFKKQGSQ